MKAGSQKKARTTHRELSYFTISAVIVTFLLFFIDEGYYDLRWMKNIGNWIMFIVYTLAALLGQLFFALVLFRKLKESRRLELSILFGTISGVGLLIFLLIRL